MLVVTLRVDEHELPQEVGGTGDVAELGVDVDKLVPFRCGDGSSIFTHSYGRASYLKLLETSTGLLTSPIRA